LKIWAHFRPRCGRKPGFPLQFRRLTSGKPSEFRFNPLREPKPQSGFGLTNRRFFPQTLPVLNQIPE
jgi:hypothetical protein